MGNLTQADHDFLDAVERHVRAKMHERDHRERMDALDLSVRAADPLTAIVDRATGPGHPSRAAALERYSSTQADLKQACGVSSGPAELHLPSSFFTRAVRTLTSTGVLSGGELLNDNVPSNFADLLAIHSPLGRLGVRFEDALGSTGRTTALLEDGLEASWCAEGVAPDESAPTSSATAMTPKEAVVWITATKAMLDSGGERVRRWLAKMMMDAVSRAATRAVFAGTGLDNQPTGVLYHSDVPVVAGGTNGLAPTWENLSLMRLGVGEAGVDLDRCQWVTSPRVGHRMMQLPAELDGGTGRLYNPNEGTSRGLMGHRVHETSHVPDDMTKGGATGVCSGLMFGDWSNVVVTMWGPPSVLVDPYSLSTTGKVRMTGWVSMDVTVVRPAAFTKMVDVLTS